MDSDYEVILAKVLSLPVSKAPETYYRQMLRQVDLNNCESVLKLDLSSSICTELHREFEDSRDELYNLRGRLRDLPIKEREDELLLC